MKRIGIASSRIAHGNMALYNFYVILISLLFSLFVFVITGATLVFALMILKYLGNEVMILDFEYDWSSLITVCLVSLSILIGIFNILAISKNIRLFQKKKL